MKIEAIGWASYTLPFRLPYATSRGVVSQRQGLIIKVRANGFSGWGEAVLMPEAPEPLPALRAAIVALTRRFLNDGVACELPAAAATDDSAAAVCFGLETALLDLQAQAASKPLSRYLNADSRAEVEVNALIARPGLEAAVAAQTAVAQGFHTIKLKIGTEASLAAEVRRIAAVREAIGPLTSLRLDPNGVWSEQQAIAAIEAMAAYDIEYVEQPLPAGDLAALARVRRAVSVAIAADEDVTDLASARAIIAAGAAQVLILKPSRLGGLRNVLEVSRLARSAGLSSLVTTSIESSIGVTACLQAAALLPENSPACGLATASLFAADLVTPPLTAAKGIMRVPQPPGLGVTLGDSASRYLGEWQEVKQ